MTGGAQVGSDSVAESLRQLERMDRVAAVVLGVGLVLVPSLLALLFRVDGFPVRHPVAASIAGMPIGGGFSAIGSECSLSSTRTRNGRSDQKASPAGKYRAREGEGVAAGRSAGPGSSASGEASAGSGARATWLLPFARRMPARNRHLPLQ